MITNLLLFVLFRSLSLLVLFFLSTPLVMVYLQKAGRTFTNTIQSSQDSTREARSCHSALHPQESLWCRCKTCTPSGGGRSCSPNASHCAIVTTFIIQIKHLQCLTYLSSQHVIVCLRDHPSVMNCFYCGRSRLFP